MGTTGSRRNPKVTRPCSVADDGNDVYFLLKHGSLAKKRKWNNGRTIAPEKHNWVTRSTYVVPRLIQ